MSRTIKSPYATSFKSGIKKGLSCGQTVCAISKRTGKNTKAIYTSLKKAGWCKGQKFNGTTTYWPNPTCVKVRTSATNAKGCAITIKQAFIDWCLTSGCCTSKSLTSNGANSAKFSSFCRKMFGRKWNAMTKGATSKTTTTAKRSTTKRNTNRNTWSTGSTWSTRTAPKTYKFAAYANRTTGTKRYRKVA